MGVFTTEDSLPPFGQRRYFSLKWQALVFTSLVLIAVTVAISWRSYINLDAQFDRHRQAAHARYVKEVQALIDQSLDRLRQLGGWIYSLPGMQNSLLAGDQNQIKQTFEQQWPVLQLDLGIDVVAFYNRENYLLASWEVTNWNKPRTQEVLNWIKQVIERETPVTAINCKPECMQYAVAPILADGQSVGVILVGSSLADVVRNFQLISGNDIGLLISSETGGNDGDRTRYVPRWDAQIVALTNAEHSLKILRSLEQRPLVAASEGVRTGYASRDYEVRLIPLPSFSAGQATRLVVIEDITKPLQEIRSASREILIAGISGWLLSELLLLAILWTPMSRLRVTAANLPLLAQRQFEAVRSSLLRQSRDRWVNNEIDILDRTAIALAHRLQQLEKEVEDRTQTLSHRMEELSQEKDFVARLLNTAQVMILTQDCRGRIVMLNSFTQSLTGYEKQELEGRHFLDLLLPDSLPPDIPQRLSELTSSKQGNLRHDALVGCKNGAIRTVTWYHSRLASRLPGDPATLSVGLDITERRGAESRLAWLADHDTLTGLLNRHRFKEELELIADAARRQNKTGALLFIDLDQFKYINDTCGHHNGDALLKVVAHALSGQIVAADVVARLGGDEFAILLRETDVQGAIGVANEINTLLSHVGITVDGQILRVSASIGIALFPHGADNVDDLLANADLAMYQAKEQGRGHWHLFSGVDQTRERMRNRVYWKEKVALALAEDRFVLYYQPIMEIASARVSHYEVLLRIRDTDDSIIGATHFIDAAERSGIIHAVDRLVLSKAIRQLAEINRRGERVAFSINLSGHAFNDPELLSHLRRELEESQVDVSKVIFEITETVAVSDFAIANNLMLAIKELGCRFALDDFGIGFSSFYYLKHLPVDYLKIDGSFIRQLTENPDDQIIVRALSHLASGFGKKTVAEYVETEETLELLREYGIDYAQGYYISKPLSAEDAFCSTKAMPLLSLP